MYIAMNRFRIAIGKEAGFEELWRTRDTQLTEVPGFQEFHLLHGGDEDGAAIYVSHTVWASRDAFDTWTKSEAFRSAHAKARAPEGTYLGPPKFEGFDVVL